MVQFDPENPPVAGENPNGAPPVEEQDSTTSPDPELVGDQ